MSRVGLHKTIYYGASSLQLHSSHTHFPGQPGLASCPIDYQSPFILILTIVTGQAKALRFHMVPVHQAETHPLVIYY